MASGASLITSKADYLRQKKFQKKVPKPSQKGCSSKEQSPIELPSQGYYVNQCVVKEDKEEMKHVGVPSQC